MFGITPSGKKSKYFCDVCKIWGHSIERCFKVHGSPNGQKPDFKAKTLAGTTQVEHDNEQNE